jgi:hypothetical protein
MTHFLPKALRNNFLILFFLLLLSVVNNSCNSSVDGVTEDVEALKEKGEEREEEEEEGKGEAYMGMELWTEMRAYPNKQLEASGFLPGFEKSLRMSARALSRDKGMRVANTSPWSELGPKNYAGRVLSIAFHPTNANIMFVGTASGGLWKTTTGGTGAPGGINWTFVPTGFPVLGVSSIVINPLNANEIYIGTGEVYNTNITGGGSTGAGHIRLFRGTYGIGILKSTDGGATWSKVLNFNNTALKGVMDMVIHPTTPDTVFAATTDGVYRTFNGGTNWTLVHNVVNAHDLHFKPGDPNVLYVGSGNFQSTGAGIYKTTNANATTPTFTKLTTGLPATISGKIMLAISANNPSKIYASIGRHPDLQTHFTGLYYSTNEGANWTASPFSGNQVNASNPSKVTNQGWYAHDIAVSPTTANTIVWGELDTWRSTNGGATSFTQVGVWSGWDVNNTTIGTLMEGTNDNYVHADVHRIVYSPHNSNTLFLCTDGGIFRSTDNGLNYQTLNGGLNTAQIYSNMAVNPTDPDYMLIGLQDNEATVYEGNPGFRRIGGLGDGFHAAIKPADGTIQFVESYYFNRRRSINSGGAFAAGTGAVAEVACFNVPMVYSQQISSNRMFAGTIYFKRSTDDGATWTNYPSNASPSAIAGANNPIISMAAPKNDTVYFSTAPAGGIRSKLWRTTNANTATFSNVTFTDISSALPDRYYSDIAVDPVDAKRVAVTLSGFGSSHVYLTIDGGNNWSDIGTGLPDVPANSVTFDPQNPYIIYIANDLGVYYSYGVPVAGSAPLAATTNLSWVAYNEGFTDAILASDLLVTSNRKLRLGSYGRGLWERDMVPETLLPSKIVSFTGIRKNAVNVLNWKVEEEANVSRYEVQYSTDNSKFETVGSAQALNASSGKNEYRFEHNNALPQTAFYRLKIVDRDGASEFSDVVRINVDNVPAGYKVYPNPTTGLVNVTVPVSKQTIINYRIVDMSGKVVVSQQVSLRPGVQQFTADMTSLSPGNYRIILEGDRIKWNTAITRIK